MSGLIINGPILLKWISTHDVNTVTAIETLSSAYFSISVPAAKLLHISRS
jgi:hypothetical protein